MEVLQSDWTTNVLEAKRQWSHKNNSKYCFAKIKEQWAFEKLKAANTS